MIETLLQNFKDRDEFTRVNFLGTKIKDEILRYEIAKDSEKSEDSALIKKYSAIEIKENINKLLLDLINTLKPIEIKTPTAKIPVTQHTDAPKQDHNAETATIEKEPLSQDDVTEKTSLFQDSVTLPNNNISELADGVEEEILAQELQEFISSVIKSDIKKPELIKSVALTSSIRDLYLELKRLDDEKNQGLLKVKNELIAIESDIEMADKTSAENKKHLEVEIAEMKAQINHLRGLPNQTSQVKEEIEEEEGKLRILEFSLTNLEQEIYLSNIVSLGQILAQKHKIWKEEKDFLEKDHEQQKKYNAFVEKVNNMYAVYVELIQENMEKEISNNQNTKKQDEQKPTSISQDSQDNSKDESAKKEETILVVNEISKRILDTIDQKFLSPLNRKIPEKYLVEMTDKRLALQNLAGELKELSSKVTNDSGFSLIHKEEITQFANAKIGKILFPYIKDAIAKSIKLEKKQTHNQVLRFFRLPLRKSKLAKNLIQIYVDLEAKSGDSSINTLQDISGIKKYAEYQKYKSKKDKMNRSKIKNPR